MGKALWLRCEASYAVRTYRQDRGGENDPEVCSGRKRRLREGEFGLLGQEREGEPVHFSLEIFEKIDLGNI